MWTLNPLSLAGIVGAAQPFLVGAVPELVEGPNPAAMERVRAPRNPGKPVTRAFPKGQSTNGVRSK